MDKALKRRWVGDLRANGSLKGSGSLSWSGGDCPLGRLCYVADLPHRRFQVGGGFFVHFGDVGEPISKHGIAGSYLPPKFAEAVGLSRSVQETLSRMNDDGGIDGGGKTFDETADWIEQNL